jgi:hypothetical protein
LDHEPECASENEVTTETRFNGCEVISLAGKVTWPFRGLNRSLGELLETGQVQSRDLGWASWNAHDPTVKWAAAIHLEAATLQGLALSLSDAEEVIWPFKGLNRPMGALLDEQVIGLHDLAYAIANAHDTQVRSAAAVLGARIVSRRLAIPLHGMAPRSEKASDVPSDTSGDLDRGGSPDGALRILDGSNYLRSQEERRGRQGRILNWFGILYLTVAVLGGISAFVALALGFGRLSAGWIVIALAMLVVSGWLVSRANRLRREAQDFSRGRRGEEKLAAFLRETLDRRWALFRNVVLPGQKGDIDAVLIGPAGVYALEIKTYRGYYRNAGIKWQKRLWGVWRRVDSNPTRQARRNAQRLHDYLKRKGVDLWIEPRIVWAGAGKVWLEQPGVSVWQFSRRERILDDLRNGKALSQEHVEQLATLMMEILRARG